MYKIKVRFKEQGIEAFFWDPMELDSGFFPGWSLSELSGSKVEGVCLECGSFLPIEPDTTRGYCPNCNRVTAVFNPVVVKDALLSSISSQNQTRR